MGFLGWESVPGRGQGTDFIIDTRWCRWQLYPNRGPPVQSTTESAAPPIDKTRKGPQQNRNPPVSGGNQSTSRNRTTPTAAALTTCPVASFRRVSRRIRFRGWLIQKRRQFPVVARGPRVVVATVGHFQKPFVAAWRCLKELPSEADRNQTIGRAVDLKYWSIVTPDPGQRVVSVVHQPADGYPWIVEPRASGVCMATIFAPTSVVSRRGGEAGEDDDHRQEGGTDQAARWRSSASAQPGRASPAW